MKQIAKIEAAEDKRDANARLSRVIKKKVDSVKYPLQLLKIAYGGQTKGKSYSEEEDRFLLVQLSKYGIGKEDTYDLIKRDISEWPAFRFDWFLKSRTPVEIGRRCTTLITLIDKEKDSEKPAPRRTPAGTFLSNKMRNAVTLGVRQYRLDAIRRDFKLFGNFRDAGKDKPTVAFDGIEMSSYKGNRRILEQ